MLALAVLGLLVPAAYLIAVLSRETPPSDEQINRATIQIVDNAYHVAIPGRPSYVIDAGASGPDQARARVRTQAADERLSYDHLWANFFFLLGGALLVSALLLLVRRVLLSDPLTPMTEPQPVKSS
jgi:hypothetical protein